jgi:hypothetical protein
MKKQSIAKKTAIKDRRRHEPTVYYPAGKITDIPNIGQIPSVLQRRWGMGEEEKDTLKLAAITADFIYYIDEKESDETAGIVMLTRDLLLVSDNYFAAQDLAELVAKNKELLWISKAVKYWQRQQFGKPALMTRKIKNALKAVDIETLTDEEKVIYSAYLHNGPVKYTKAESLMAVLSIDLELPYSDQLQKIGRMLPKTGD